jgi:hypothetical protein
MTTSPPAGATYVCELRPAQGQGSGYEVLARSRILAWHKAEDGLLLPRTAGGVVPREAFVPSATRPESGCSYIECRDAAGKRMWTLPGQTRQVDDAGLRVLLRSTIAMVRARGNKR